MSIPARTRLLGPPRAALVVLAAAAAAGVLLCASCNYGEVTVVEPAAKSRGALTLSIQPDPEDSAVARELGWTSGIPGAEVTVSPGDADTISGPPVAVIQTDSLGKATVPDLPDGKYLVEVRRLLTSSEGARLAPTEDVIGFMTNTVVARGSTTLLTPASRRRSLVISEWAFQPLWAGIGVGWYSFGGYLELANNSDTTIYLDGLVIGEAYTLAAEFGPGMCARSEGSTNDPDYLWSKYFDSLPGTGHTYPLAPGATALIATDGIDHSGIAPAGLDLSHADFEFTGSADVDNPAVPNTVSIGLQDYWFGHGLFLNETLDELMFVALPLDVASLPLAPGHDYVRVPRSKVLDVLTLLSTYQFREAICPHLVNRNFDRHWGRFGPVGGGSSVTESQEGFYSVQRKVAYIRADGRKILQHTRTSNADFFLGLRTPGQLP